MTNHDYTDAELIEHARDTMQRTLGRCLEALDEGKSLPEFFANDPLPSLTVTVSAADLREVGSFMLDLPPYARGIPRRQWVYERKSDKTMFVISWKTRGALLTRGYADMPAMVDDPGEHN